MIQRRIDDCGCCEGTVVLTPVRVENRAGLSAIAYRVGTHGAFKRSMLARLSGSDLLALAGLHTREDDDFSIALLDAWAVVGDVLTFYQERIANESYLRTAIERLSVRELARLIGYQLRPGVAAQTYVAFTLETTPGAPASITLEPGVKVQSVPGPDEKPQTFETVEKIEARPTWNALPAVVTAPEQIVVGRTDLYLRGTVTRLQRGDAILILGAERETSFFTLRWSFRIVQTVEADSRNNRTRITWAVPPHLLTVPQSGTKVFALRQRAAIFGHNAPDPRIADPNHALSSGNDDQWNNFAPPTDRIELDAVYPRVVAGSWVVLARTTSTGDLDLKLYRADAVSTVSQSAFALSAKINRIRPDHTTDLDKATRRQTAAFVESEELTLGDRPLPTTVQGLSVDIAGSVEGLATPRMIVLSGKETDDGPTLSELAEVVQIEQVGGATRLHLEDALNGNYLRSTVTVNANVVLATQGETVREVLGAGDPAQPFQHFALRQSPLTYTSAATASGRESTLQIRINDLLWHEVPTLYGRGPKDHVYATRTEEGGATTIVFGDGVTGARLPRGQENVRALYRKGIGLQGLVKAGQLTTLLSRPLGVKEVTNPQDATGADDPEVLADARQNAPVTVLTLDRVVSLQDYEDFARTFAGIAKALATWTWEGWARSVFLTVAGPDGAPPDAMMITNLTAALRTFGDPHVRFHVAPFRSATFQIVAHVKVDPDQEPDKVLTAVTNALRARFSFEARGFGQPVVLSEVIAAIQGVSGVVAADVDSLYRTGDPVALNTRLLAAMLEGVLGAELLRLDEIAPGLDVMS